MDSLLVIVDSLNTRITILDAQLSNCTPKPETSEVLVAMGIMIILAVAIRLIQST